MGLFNIFNKKEVNSSVVLDEAIAFKAQKHAESEINRILIENPTLDNSKHEYVTQLASNNNINLEGNNRAIKGIVQSEQVQFPKELGDQHPFDLKIAEGLYRRFPLAFGIVDKFVDFVLGPGITVQSENKKAQDIIETWLQDIDFNSILKAWLREALMKGTGYLEIGLSKEKQIGLLKLLDAQWIYVKRDEFGKIEEFNQWIGSFVNFFKNKNKIVNFEPDEIVMLPINVVGDCAYGIGILSPLFGSFDNLMGLEKMMNRIMQRKANQPIHWKVGFLSNFLKILPKTSTVDKIRDKMTHLRNETEFVTGPDMEAKVIDYGNMMEKFDLPLEHNNKQVFAGSQIPEVLFGSGNIAEGLAKEQRSALDAKVKSIQIDVEKVIERQLFRRVLQAQGIDEHVEVIWGAPSDDEVNAEIKNIIELLKNPLIDPRLAHELQRKLAALMDLPEQTIPDDPPEMTDEQNDAEKDKEEEKSQPLVPGSNRVKNKREIELQHGFIEDKDYSIKEWLGFNFEVYQDAIKKVLSKDKFEMLSAQTQDQIEAGLLTTPQVEELRDVLGEGFTDEKSINEISSDIDSRVKPGDRFKLDKQGNLVKDAVGNNVLAVSSVARGKLIARTEISRIANLGAVDNYEEADVEQYKWVATASDRTCPICLELDGQIFDINSSGRKLPPTSSHQMCRCTVVPIVNLKGRADVKENVNNKETK